MPTVRTVESPSQDRAESILREQGPMSMMELADAVGPTRAYGLRTVRRLVDSRRARAVWDPADWQKGRPTRQRRLVVLDEHVTPQFVADVIAALGAVEGLPATTASNWLALVEEFGPLPEPPAAEEGE